MSEMILEKPRLSFKTQTLAAAAAIIGAVAVPQVFHVIGAASGMGTSLGEIFLPMHLPIILVGMLAGPYAGAVAGLLGPLVSFSLSGMPSAAILPFMMAELCAYGLFAGLLRNVKMPGVAKILLVQAGGRIVRFGAVLTAIYAFGNEGMNAMSVWTAAKTGLFGLCLQWVLLPLLVYRIENMKKHE